MERIRTKTPIPRQWLGWLISLMALSTLLFVIGIFIERGGETSETADMHNAPPSLAITRVSENNEFGNEGSERATPTTHVESGESGNEASERATEIPTTHDENSEMKGIPAETTAETSGEATHAETILGINIENPAIVIVAVVVWVALIVLVTWLGRIVLLPVIVVALGTTIYDLAEVVFQIGRSNSGLTILAALVALTHIAVAAIASFILVRQAASTAQTKA